jgi:hypothetical protein
MFELLLCSVLENANGIKTADASEAAEGPEALVIRLRSAYKDLYNSVLLLCNAETGHAVDIMTRVRGQMKE